ncbi:uncharacterized protein LOC113307382 [Papaver somniferum]|uniref:uncharacterized protein LOC113307382 n=1 Tax=Papaver somniferum TaxID=3469 RepID=UPI000E6F7C4C|nr:uncharacterized protein LOC113307382 [Papaver somniferum]
MEKIKKKGAVFWRKIIEEYDKIKGTNGTTRDKKSLQTRCNTLRTEVKRYLSHVRPYFRNKPSGLGEQDYYCLGQHNYEAEVGRQRKTNLESVFQILKTYQPDYNPVMNNDDGAGTSTQPTQQTQATQENEADNMDEDLENMARFGSSSSTHNSETSDISRRRRYFEQTDDVRSGGRDQAKKRDREVKASQKAYEKNG